MDWSLISAELAAITILGAVIAWVIKQNSDNVKSVQSEIYAQAERIEADLSNIHARVNGIVASAADTIKRLEYEQRMGAIETRFESRIASMEHKMDDGFRGINTRLDNVLKRD